MKVNKKVKITFVLPAALQHEMRERIVIDGYGLRGKSKWVSESILSLLSLNNYIELVKISNEMHSHGKSDTVTLDESVRRSLEKAIVDIRKVYPMLEGVQSRILRTSIVQRILRE